MLRPGRSFWLVALLVMGAVTLTALAYASPPDPSWVQGVYDGDDADDVVACLVSADGVRPSSPKILRLERVVGRVALPEPRAERSIARPTSPTRGPPALSFSD